MCALEVVPETCVTPIAGACAAAAAGQARDDAKAVAEAKQALADAKAASADDETKKDPAKLEAANKAVADAQAALTAATTAAGGSVLPRGPAPVQRN